MDDVAQNTRAGRSCAISMEIPTGFTANKVACNKRGAQEYPVQDVPAGAPETLRPLSLAGILHVWQQITAGARRIYLGMINQQRSMAPSLCGACHYAAKILCCFRRGPGSTGDDAGCRDC